MNFDSSNKAIFLQITDRICDQIVAGEYADDARLPSVREYAASVEVNANTVMRAYDRLADKGLIYNRRGIGYFVVPGAKLQIIKERGEDLIESKLEPMFDLLHHMGVSPDALRDAYREYIDKQK